MYTASAVASSVRLLSDSVNIMVKIGRMPKSRVYMVIKGYLGDIGQGNTLISWL